MKECKLLLKKAFDCNNERVMVMEYSCLFGLIESNKYLK